MMQIPLILKPRIWTCICSFVMILPNIYDTRDDFDFPFLAGDVPRSTSYGVYISQLIRLLDLTSTLTWVKCGT